MSQTFLEANEIVPMNEIPDTIRAEITGKTDAEIAEIKQTIIDIMAGLNYRLVKHTCRHLEGLGCIEEVL